MFLKLLRGGIWFTTLTVAGRINFCWKKKRPFKKIFQLPFNYGKRDDKKSSFFSLSESHAGRLLSCVFVCDPNSFLMRVGADAAGMSEEKEVEREVFILNFGE